MTIDQKAQLILKALKFAEKKHKNQKRKITGSPYIHHPIIVSYLCANFKSSKKLHLLICAAILHDTIEDTNTKPEEIAKEFGLEIAALVFELTDDKSEIKKIGKVEYQKRKWIGISNYAFYIKLCDRLYNISDTPTEEYIKNTNELIHHIKKNRSLTKSQKTVIQEIENQINSCI